MSNEILITTNAGYFSERFARYLARSIQITRRTAEEVVREQAKMLVQVAFAYTPPMGGQYRKRDKTAKFPKGYRASHKAIERTLKLATIIKNRDVISRALRKARDEGKREQLKAILEELDEPAQRVVAYVRQYQRPNKQWPKNNQKFHTTKEKRKQAVTILARTIGVTAAGWCAAADRLGVSYPEWIGRWKARNSGTMTIRVEPTLIQFTARNANKHSDAGAIQRSLDSAFEVQANAMRRSLISAISDGVLRREDVFGR